MYINLSQPHSRVNVTLLLHVETGKPINCTEQGALIHTQQNIQEQT